MSLAILLELHADDGAVGRLNGADLGVDLDLRAGLARGLAIGLRDLAVALPRVEEPAGFVPRAEPGQSSKHLTDHPRQGVGVDPAASLGDRDLVRRNAPDLAGVGKVELLADGSAKAGFEHGGE